MAREGRDQSGQRPPELGSPGRAAGRGVRPERFPQPCPRSAEPAGNSCLQPAAPDRPQGESGGRRSAPPRRTSPRAPPAPSFPLSPSHSRLLPPHSGLPCFLMGGGKQRKNRDEGRPSPKAQGHLHQQHVSAR
uniref:POU domain, class 5, transcription factor 3-like n=1 Tax=Macaca mulatta TaxID=9544 RepID=UPI0010A286B1|nr:POU domain, class 5, transcription factor 3-like [Macaca mulatta]